MFKIINTLKLVFAILCQEAEFDVEKFISHSLFQGDLLKMYNKEVKACGKNFYRIILKTDWFIHSVLSAWSLEVNCTFFVNRYYRLNILFPQLALYPQATMFKVLVYSEFFRTFQINLVLSNLNFKLNLKYYVIFCLKVALFFMLIA